MSTASSELLFEAGGRHCLIVLRHAPRARRMRLSVDPRDGAVRLTVPRRTPVKKALAWAAAHRDWVERALAALPRPLPIGPGTMVPFEGSGLEVVWSGSAPRAPRVDGARLIVGGPEQAIAPRVLRWLRAEAARRLDAETRALAARAGLEVGCVRVGDARTRWGSCTAGGDIRYNWRLILAPPWVRAATVAHELAHRVHMNHGPAFHRLAAELLGEDPARARRWLRVHGPELYWVGRPC